MRLTKQKAIDISIELWEWLAESGSAFKYKWIGWGKYGRMDCSCPLCEYISRKRRADCRDCPYTIKFVLCMGGVYRRWDGEPTKKGRKKYAEQFLAQLRELKK